MDEQQILAVEMENSEKTVDGLLHLCTTSREQHVHHLGEILEELARDVAARDVAAERVHLHQLVHGPQRDVALRQQTARGRGKTHPRKVYHSSSATVATVCLLYTSPSPRD